MTGAWLFFHPESVEFAPRRKPKSAALCYILSP
jgi:hypothetical protein